MSAATALRVSGFVILVLALAVGLMPVYANTAIGDSWSNFNLTINGFQVMDIVRLSNGELATTVTSAVWFVAAFGELLIIAAWLKDTTHHKVMSLRLSQPL